MSAVLAVVLGALCFLGAVLHTDREPMVKIQPCEAISYGADTSSGASLVQVGARLYYSIPYEESPLRYGIYEIYNQGISRVWWGGFRLGAQNVPEYTSLAVHEGELACVDRETAQISTFNRESGEFSPLDGVYSRYVKTQLELREFADDKDGELLFTELFAEAYFVMEEMGTEGLYRRTDAGIVEKICNFGDFVDGGKCQRLYSMGAAVYAELMSENGVLCLQYLSQQDSLMLLPAHEYQGKPVFTTEGTYGVYVNNPEEFTEGDIGVGIFVTRMETGERRCVYSGYVKDYFVLDKEWVYFTLEDNSLYRVDFEGEVLEQVF